MSGLYILARNFFFDCNSYVHMTPRGRYKSLEQSRPYRCAIGMILIMLGSGCIGISLWLTDAPPTNGTGADICGSKLQPGRIRRNMNRLSTEERNRFMEALWIMKSTSTEKGRARFGPVFSSYDDIVSEHMNATWDQVPFNFLKHGFGFIPYHRLITLRIESILNAIDPRIHALPYWDHDEYQSIHDPIWTDEWFGGRSDGYATMARFPNWTIARPWSSLSNSYGFLRLNAYHDVYGDPRLLRMKTNYETALDHRACLRIDSFRDFHECLMLEHLRVHMLVGGESNNYSAITRVVGDYNDRLSAPNDPIFVVHHSNVERFIVAWQRRYNSTNCYYDFPPIAFRDQARDDVVTPRTPFFLKRDCNNPVTNGMAFCMQLPYVYDELPSR